MDGVRLNLIVLDVELSPLRNTIDALHELRRSTVLSRREVQG